MSVERERCVRNWWVGWLRPGEMSEVLRTAGHSGSPCGKGDDRVRLGLTGGERQRQARKAREAMGRRRAQAVTRGSLMAGS